MAIFGVFPAGVLFRGPSLRIAPRPRDSYRPPSLTSDRPKILADALPIALEWTEAAPNRVGWAFAGETSDTLAASGGFEGPPQAGMVGSAHPTIDSKVEMTVRQLLSWPRIAFL
jgi:hypothetical protein